MTSSPGRSPDHQPARDGDRPIREEFERALASKDIAALELAIARHPDHPLAEEARKALESLRREG